MIIILIWKQSNIYLIEHNKINNNPNIKIRQKPYSYYDLIQIPNYELFDELEQKMKQKMISINNKRNEYINILLESDKIDDNIKNELKTLK